MSEIFTNILTKIGQQKKAQAEANNTGLNITSFKIGDGNGTYYQPNENQTALVNVKYAGNFVAGTQSQIVVNSLNLNEVLYKCFIPADVGGFTIRELGLFDLEGDLILICKLPAQDKFALSSGLYQPLTFTPKIVYTNPQINAVLTPASQIVPTTGEVASIVEMIISENIQNITYDTPIKNINGTVSLKFDETLKLLNNKLSVETNNFVKKDGSIAFTAEQKGVDAENPSGLMTKQQVEALLSEINIFTSGTSNMPPMANNVSDVNNDIDFWAGFCYDLTTNIKITNTALTKKLDTVFSAGTNQGGLDAGAKANNTWYHSYAISKADGTSDFLFSTSATAPTMPSGFVNKRRIGSIKTNASGNIIQFKQNGDYVWFKTTIGDLSLTNVGNIPLTDLVTSACPNTLGMFDAYVTGSPSNSASTFMALDKTITSTDTRVIAECYGGNYNRQVNAFFMNVDSLSRIQYSHAYVAYVASGVGINCLGYIDLRGAN